MQFIKRNLWSLATMALVLVIAMVGDVSAQGTVTGSSIMGEAADKGREVFDAVKTIIFILGGFGLVGLAWAALWGKVNWKWLAALAVGLAILAAASSIVEYATGDQRATNENFNTTFGNI